MPDCNISKDLAQFIQLEILKPLAWADLTEYVDKWVTRRQKTGNDLFPVFVCSSVGGRLEEAIPLAAYWTLSIAAARLLDDWHDGQGDSSISPQSASLLSTGLIGAAQASLAFLPSDSLSDVTRNLGNTLTLISKAQFETHRIADTESYLRRVSGLTGLAWAAVGWAAARIVTADPNIQHVGKELGFNIGMVSAIADDLSDVHEDLKNEVFTLPVIHALSQVESSSQSRFLAKLKACENRAAIYQILKESSSIEYSLGLMSTYWRKSSQLITQLDGNKEGIEKYVQSLIRTS